MPSSAYVQDLTKLLRLSHNFRVRVIFSSAGGDGTDEHVEIMEEIIKEVVEEEGNVEYFFKTISIFSGIDKRTVLQRLREGRITRCGTCVPPLTAAEVEASPRVVAQVGSEPFLDAMEANPGFDVVIGGRAYDPAPYIAYAMYELKRQYPSLSPPELKSRLGGFNHMGKIMECRGACSVPKSHGAIATIYPSGLFEVRPMAPESRCTPQSVAAHALYENTRPDILSGLVGGSMHLKDVIYEQLPDGKSVRVSGSKHRSSEEDDKPYCFKLEAARVVGYRSVSMGGVRDHVMISQIDTVLGTVKSYVKSQHKDVTGEWDLNFHVYGRDQYAAKGPGEVFVVAESLAPTQQIANSIASKARVGMIHAPYSGQKATAGNFGFGIGGLMEYEMGQCSEFSIYHLMELDPGEEHLSFGVEGAMIRANVATFGHGHPVQSDAEFRAHIARLRGTLQQPSPSPYVNAESKLSKPKAPRYLGDLCQVMRSKNAGPFEITLDAVFLSKEEFELVKNSNILMRTSVTEALGIDPKDIIWMGFFEPALAFKVTVPRVRGGKRTAAGGFMENDVHGSQEHVGLASLELPKDSAGLTASLVRRAGWSKEVALVAALGTLGTVKCRVSSCEKDSKFRTLRVGSFQKPRRNSALVDNSHFAELDKPHQQSHDALDEAPSISQRSTEMDAATASSPQKESAPEGKDTDPAGTVAPDPFVALAYDLPTLQSYAFQGLRLDHPDAQQSSRGIVSGLIPEKANSRRTMIELSGEAESLGQTEKET